MSPSSHPHDRSRSRYAIARDVLGRLTLGERMLIALSKHPADVAIVSDYEEPTDAWTVETALETFDVAFPSFRESLRGKRVLDYGCGDGFQSVAAAKAGAREVLGVDISEARLGFARDLKRVNGADNVEFAKRISGTYDVVLSLDAIEHFVAPEENMLEMKSALTKGGRIFATFGPLWFAPFGHHMNFFARVPWLNLLFSEKTVYRVRSIYRTDGHTSYIPDLNKMTVKKFEALIEHCGLRPEKLVYRVVKDLPLVAKVPFLRELLINQIDVVLVPAEVNQEVLVPQPASVSSPTKNRQSSPEKVRS